MSDGGEGAALARIAAALERIAPPPTPQTDWRAAPAYLWEGEQARPVPVLDALPLDALQGIEAQKVSLRNLCSRLASGAAAHDALLWGARGMGKSALVRACHDLGIVVLAYSPLGMGRLAGKY